LCDGGFVRDSKDRSNPFLELLKVFYLLIYFFWGIASVKLLNKGLNPFKSVATYIARNKYDLFVVRYLFSLEQEKQILLHKLVVKLSAISIVEVRLVNDYVVS
jgi:hypothetical protein